jgi:hypothetical protein
MVRKTGPNRLRTGLEEGNTGVLAGLLKALLAALPPLATFFMAVGAGFAQTREVVIAYQDMVADRHGIALGNLRYVGFEKFATLPIYHLSGGCSSVSV